MHKNQTKPKHLSIWQDHMGFEEFVDFAQKPSHRALDNREKPSLWPKVFFTNRKKLI